MSSRPSPQRRIQSIFVDGHSRHVGARYGLEIELELAVAPSRTVWGEEFGLDRYWNTVEDGSLRRGIELVSVPLTPATVPEAVTIAYNWAGASGRAPSVRCGLHIHANMGGHTAARLKEVLGAYILAEPYLFAYVGKEREQSIYCIPWYFDRQQYDVAAAICKSASTDERVVYRAIPGAEGACKYSALNLLPLFRFHTIEFRHAPSYPTAAGTIRWFELVSAVAEKAPWVASRPDPVEAMDTLMKDYLNSGQVDVARECREEYDTPTAYRRFLRKSEVCTYKAQGWGMPAALEAESLGVYVEGIRNTRASRTAPVRARTPAPPLTTRAERLAAAAARLREPVRLDVPAEVGTTPQVEGWGLGELIFATTAETTANVIITNNTAPRRR